MKIQSVFTKVNSGKGCEILNLVIKIAQLTDASVKSVQFATAGLRPDHPENEY
jgi:hypothetical protein